MTELELEGVITLIAKYVRAIVQQTKVPYEEVDSYLLQEHVSKLRNLLQRLPAITHEAPEEVHLNKATLALLGTTLKFLMAKKNGVVSEDNDLGHNLEIFRNAFAVWTNFSRSYFGILVLKLISSQNRAKIKRTKTRKEEH